MTYEEVLAKARSMGLNCRVCPVCDGRACRGEVPGVGAKGSGKAFTGSVEYLRSIDINLDAVYESRGQDTSCAMFGRTWSMPVFGAPVGGAAFNYGCKTVTDDALTGARRSAEPRRPARPPSPLTAPGTSILPPACGRLQGIRRARSSRR
jgi:hypothetical protein